MLEEKSISGSSISNEMRMAINDVLHDSDFINSLAEALIKKIKIEELKRILKVGIDSGAGNPAEAVFDRLEAKYSNML